MSPRELAWEEEGMGLAKRTENKCWGQGHDEERDLKTLDLKVREEGVHHHPLERVAPLRERLGNNLEGEHPSLAALATSSHTHMGIGSGNTRPWPRASWHENSHCRPHFFLGGRKLWML